MVQGPGPYLEIKLSHLTIFICSLPLGSALLCVLLSIALHWDEVTRTHCSVPNYVPSISAATGDYSPEKYIWRIGIAYHSFFRMVAPIGYYKYYKLKACIYSYPKWFPFMNLLNSLVNTVEVLSLVLLTYISSTDNFDIHETSFVVFQVCAMIYMLLTCFLYKWTLSSPPTEEESVSLRWKVVLLFVNYLSFAMAVYFYFRHNWYCEQGVYSLFAFCEYITVISNIVFHGTIAFDIKGNFTFGQKPKTVPKRQ